MKNSYKIKFNFLFSLCAFLVFTVSCDRDLSDDAEVATFPKNGEVFIDGFSAGLEYLPFGDSYFEAFSVDAETRFNGSAAMRFDVPPVGDPNGAYAGAIFPDNGRRDLSDFDALTFYAKATKTASINEIGFGQDFAENKYQVTLNGLDLTTNWRKYTIAIPDPSKLTEERGLFWYSEGPENGEGYTFWIDDLQFESLGTIGQPRPSIWNGTDETIQTFLGVTTRIPDLKFTANLESGIDQTTSITPAYFEFTSSDPSVATVDTNGVVTAVGMGTAVITATLNGIEAAGSGTINVIGAFEHAPVPMQNAEDVISIFSNAYVNEPVDYYNGYWAPFQTTQGQNDLTINGDDIIYYTDLNFVGIQFAVDAPTIDISQMTHFHIDLQVQDEIQSGDFVTVRLVDAGADNTLGTGDDASAEVTLNTTLVQGEWVSVDVSFAELSSLTSRSNLAQIVFVSDATVSEIFVDNIYFYKGSGGGPTGPTTAAPTPTTDPADVISVFSDAYTNIVDTDFNPDWGQATVVSQMPIAGNNTLRYAGLNFQGIVLGSAQDVSAMTHLHIDFWTSNSTALNAFLISDGPVETASALTVPTSDWASVDIPLDQFSPVDLMNVIQMKFDGNGDIYLDNIYFYKSGGMSNMPTTAAPTPTHDPADVISVFSDAYTNIPGTDLNPDWGQATVVSETPVDGNNTLVYTGLNYQGIQLGSATDASAMTHLHLDVWTANSSALNTFLISTGPVETASAVAVPTSGWLSVDIALGDFSPVNLADVIQMKFDGNGDIYLDNIYFYRDGGMSNMPTTAAPTPTQDPADVISVFSDAYTNIPGTDLNPDWGQATTVSETPVDGNNTLVYSGLDFQGIILGSATDASAMTHLHLDVWTANSSALNTFLISSGPVETPSALAVPTSGWLSVDIPLADFSPVDIADIIQMKFEGNGDIYLDNIYFYTDGSSSNMPTTAAPTPTQDPADVISVFSDAYTNISGTDLNPDWGQATVVSETPVDGNNTLVYTGLNYQGIQLGSATDASAMTHLHLDVWTSNSSALNTFLISTGPVETASAISVPTSGWLSLDIPLADFSPVDITDIIQMKFDGNGDIYLDNIYFYTDGSSSNMPTTAAPTPTQDPADVISVFSDAYTNVPGTDLNPDWGQATVVTETPIGGNNTLVYTGLNYQGIQLGSATDASAMTHLHLDVWTASSSALNTFLISTGPVETASAISVPTSGWLSVDIPLGDFSPVDIADIIQMKFDGNGDIYLDNIYFYKEVTASEPELPLDFENGETLIAFDGGATAANVPNPDLNGNPSANVLQFNKVVGSAWYSGVVFDETSRTTPLIDLQNGTIFTIKIWSPNADIPVRFQLEGGVPDPGTTPSYELFQTVTTANEWVTLTFDFTSIVNASDEYTKFSIFPDFDPNDQNPVSVEAIYYIDDITQQ